MKRIFCIIIVLLLSLMISVTAFAEERGERLIDSANLLSERERAEISEMLDRKSEELQFDFVIVTVNSLGGESAFDSATHYYESGNYGYGDDYTGAILLISMKEREWYIASCGEGESIIPDGYIDDDFVALLSAGRYFDSFTEYVNAVDERITDHRTFHWGISLIVAVVIGFVAAFIITAVMKGKLKTVKFQNNAREYLRNGSLTVTVSRDLFLYSTITRRAIPKSNSGGGHSSSGRSYGGGGGKF